MNYEKPEMEFIKSGENVQTNDFIVGSVNNEGDGDSITPYSVF